MYRLYRCDYPGEFGSFNTCFDNLVEIGILQGCTHPFLVSKLSVNGVLADMAAFADANVDPEGGWEDGLEVDFDAEADEGGHAAVGDGGGEGDDDLGVAQVDRDMLKLDDIQLLQGKGMLRIINIPYQI